MIIVAAKVNVKKGEEENFIKFANVCVNETRKESGNISYTLLRNTEDASKFTFFEEWESQASLDEHMQSSHFKQFGADIKDLLAAQLEVNIYDGTKIS